MRCDYEPGAPFRARHVEPAAVHELATKGNIPKYTRSNAVGGVPACSALDLSKRCKAGFRPFASLALSSVVIPRTKLAPANKTAAANHKFLFDLCSKSGIRLPGFDVTAAWLHDGEVCRHPLVIPHSDVKQERRRDPRNPMMWIALALSSAAVAKNNLGKRQSQGNRAEEAGNGLRMVAIVVGQGLRELPHSAVLRPIYAGMILAQKMDQQFDESASDSVVSNRVFDTVMRSTCYHVYRVAAGRYGNQPSIAAGVLHCGAITIAMARPYSSDVEFTPKSTGCRWVSAILDLELQALAKLAELPPYEVLNKEVLLHWVETFLLETSSRHDRRGAVIRGVRGNPKILSPRGSRGSGPSQSCVSYPLQQGSTNIKISTP